ncbi:hypothetical protein ACFL2H_00580 [Planctomycetota bacterium]
MNRTFYGLFLASIVALVSFGCAPEDAADTATETPAAPESGETAEAHPEHATMLCGKCGNEAGSEACCAEGATSCEKCGLHEGSKLCCVDLPEDAAGKNICGGCGVAVGADEHHHCDKTAEKCEKCGLNAGSAGCCKISP